MKRLIYFFITGFLFAVDNQINELYPQADDDVSFYGREYVENATEISNYFNNQNISLNGQRVLQFDQMPCVTIKGMEINAVTKDSSFLYLSTQKVKQSGKFSFKDSIVTLYAEIDSRKINYKTTSEISGQMSEYSSNDIGLKTDGIFSCLEIDADRKSFIIGTGDGKILEYDFENIRWLPGINAAPCTIEGLWLIRNNKILIFKTNNYLYFKNRSFDKPLIRIPLPKYFSKIYWDDKNNKIVFSHAGARAIYYINTSLDNDVAVAIPKFYLFGEGLSYHHLMFLRTLREVKRMMTNSSKEFGNDTPKQYIAALMKKNHAQLFEPMVADVFDNYLNRLWSMNFTQSC